MVPFPERMRRGDFGKVRVCRALGQKLARHIQRDPQLRSASAAYDAGYEEGLRVGYETGHCEGVEEGRREGFEEGRREGYRRGHDDGEEKGRREAE